MHQHDPPVLTVTAHFCILMLHAAIGDCYVPGLPSKVWIQIDAIAESQVLCLSKVQCAICWRA